MSEKTLKLALIAPAAPPFGGMSIQASLLEDFLVKEGIKVCNIPTNRSSASIEPVIQGIAGVRTFVREVFFLGRMVLAVLNSDVVHILACSHLYFFLNVIPSIFLGRLFKKHVLVNYRGGEAKSFFNGRGRQFIWVLRKASSVSVPSDYLREIFEKLSIQSTVVPNIVDMDRFSFRLPADAAKTRFICTRNFEPYYDVPTALRAFRIVRNALDDVQLSLIGEGSQRRRIERLLSELNLRDSVHMLGRVEPEDMPRYLSEADIFVNPSIVDNYPNTILEAFASGLPVVTTSAGGISYLAKDGINSLLVNTGDYEAMAKAMIRLSKNHGLRLALAKAGKNTADLHSWATVWPELQRQYGII